MWKVLLDLLAAERRPLIFVDTETAGLGLPPCEVGALVWAPWEAPQDDAFTLMMRPLVPAGLTYASALRLNPGVPITAGAGRVHGISDKDVRACPRYDDLEVRATFQSWALGDAAEGWGPAVWAGHNVAEADLPWMVLWGYLPAWPGDGATVDTMRVFWRLAREHPHPLAVDLIPDSTQVLAVSVGLDAFAASLTGVHAALTGRRPEGAHGALADCAASAVSLAMMLEMWGPLWSAQSLPALLAALNAPEPGRVSWDGWLRDEGEGLRWAKGKFRGQVPHRDAWVLGLPRAPTGREGEHYWCSDQTAAVLEKSRAMAVAR